MKSIVLTLLLFTISTSFQSSSQATAVCNSCQISDQILSGIPYYANPYLPYCPTCQAAMMQNYAFPQPWWYGMNQSMGYPNFFSPGPYNGWGINPQFFPTTPFFPNHRGGGVMLDKPVVYVSAPDQTEVSIELKPKPETQMLATVPAYHLKWNAKVEGNTLKTSEGKYDYFFYDLRADESKMQDIAGHCGDRNEVLQYMADGLKHKNFPDHSIHEFKSTWSIKLPWHQTLCVYPQTERELKHNIEILITPKNAKLTQMEYIVVPTQYHQNSEAKIIKKFSRAPVKEFSFGNREVAKSDEVHVYDWGVGFMVVDHRKSKQ